MIKLVKKVLNDDIGSVLIMVVAVMLSVVAVSSSASLMVITTRGQLQAQYSQDKIQEELLLRTEANRLHLAIEHDDNRPLPDRDVEIIEPDRVTTYHIKSKGQQIIIDSFMGLATEQAYAIQSLISAKRARKLALSYQSPVKRYSERLIKNKSLAEYQYFTDIEASENEDGGFAAALVKFYGADDLYGPVHSNDDIWIQNSGGWPTFHDMVTTAGRIMDFTTMAPAEDSAPMEQIFLGGYLEEVAPIIFNPTAEEIRQNANWIGEDKEIVYVKLGNGSFDVKYADVTSHVDTFGVYSWFPHTENLANQAAVAGANWFEESDHIWTNYITMYDTIWTPGTGFSVLNQSVFIPDGELWIEGEVYGRQTFGCADTVFIVGDITYENTPAGSIPDDPDDPNTSDYFGLVSEKKILIRYKHKDPFNDMVLRDDNCGGVMLYGAYAAIGLGDESIYGDMACHYDGIFTFQYHHPHGSTPDFEAYSPYVYDVYSINLMDSGGDGWDGAELDLYVNGEIELEDISCTGSYSTHDFAVNNGDIIETVYTPGGSDDENTYEIVNGDGDVVAADGPSPGAGVVYQVILSEFQDTVYTYIDLHKYVFPPSGVVPPTISGFELHGGNPVVNTTCGFPFENPGYINSYPNNGPNYVYPYGTDYPWYNPVWPESATDLVFERGDLSIYGAIAQRRRGFIHRSGSDPYNHPSNEWDMDQYHYDGVHGSSGYDKDYHYDKRLMYIQPPHFPQIYEGWGETTLTAFEKKSWFFKAPPDNF